MREEEGGGEKGAGGGEEYLSSGCCNNLTDLVLNRHLNSRHLFFAVLEAGKSKSRH